MLRIVTATLLIAVVVVATWVLPPWGTAIVAAIAAAFAGAELARIAAKAGASVPPAFLGLASAALAVAFVVYEPSVPGSEDDSLGAVLLALLVASGTITLTLGPPGPTTIARAAIMTMGPLYVGLPLGAILWVQWVFGPETTSWLLGTIVVSDSAQYYTGRMVGRTKLAPAVSPAKTVEGAIGGLIAAAILGALVGPRCLPDMSMWFGALVAFLIATFGIAGDLFESLLKRSAGVKDSSAMIPGHGGVLDRLDSHLFAAPVFYLILRFRYLA